MLDWKGALYLAGAFALAGSSVIAAKMLAGSLDNLAVTAASLFLALTVLLPACMFKQENASSPPPQKSGARGPCKAFLGSSSSGGSCSRV